MKLIDLFIPILLSLVVSVVLFPIGVYLLKKWNVVDHPNFRKFQKSPVPTLGGVLIFLSVVLSCFILTRGSIHSFSNWPFWVGITAILILGVVDDLLDIKPVIKLGFQFLIFAFLVIQGDFFVEWEVLFGFVGLPLILNQLLTIIFFVFIVNAFNVIDGADGVGGTVSLFFLVVAAYIFYSSLETQYLEIASLLLGAIIGFLIYNWAPAKIYMGDSGSNFVGLCCACFMVVILMNTQFSAQTRLEIVNPVSTLLSVFSFPIFDLLRVIVLRSIKRKPLFKADKLHINSLLMRKGWPHYKIAGSVAVFTGIMFCISQVLSGYFVDWFCLLVLFVIGVVAHFAFGKWVESKK